MSKTASYIEETVEVLIVPLRGQNIVVPQAVVSEIVPVPEIAQEDIDNDNWLRGNIEWHGQSIPLVSIEMLCSESASENLGRTRRVAIFRGLKKLEDVEFYAVEVNSIPHPVRLSKLDIQSLDEDQPCEFFQQAVKASGVFGHILDFDLLEERINKKLTPAS